MAKLYWNTLTIYDAGSTANGATISGTIVSDDKITQEDERATIEDNQEIQISLSGRFEIETRNLSDDASSAIMSDTRLNTDGAEKCNLMLTANTGATATLSNVYANARKKIISTGEIGIMIDGQRSDEVSSDPVTYA